MMFDELNEVAGDDEELLAMYEYAREEVHRIRKELAVWDIDEETERKLLASVKMMRLIRDTLRPHVNSTRSFKARVPGGGQF